MCMDNYFPKKIQKISGSQEDTHISILGCPHSIFGRRGHEDTRILLPCNTSIGLVADGESDANFFIDHFLCIMYVFFQKYQCQIIPLLLYFHIHIFHVWMAYCKKGFSWISN